MKKIQLTIILAIVCIIQLSAQKYFTKTGVIDFEASVPAFEPVKAKNENVTAILNMETGEIAFLALMKGFRFRNALMEEHFNENYAESDSYPKATFKGTVQDFSLENLTSPFTVQGTLSLHGSSKEITTEVKLSRQGEAIMFLTDFSVSPADFNIKIPGIVREKISDKILVTVQCELIEK